MIQPISYVSGNIDMNRRYFLKTLSLLSLQLNVFNLANAEVANSKSIKRLILVELKGGNDGLNTVIPYKNKEYYKARPTLAVDAEMVLPLDNAIGLNPALDALIPMWDNKELGIIQGVGYPNPNRSHFESIDIWNTANPVFATDETEGWIPQVLHGKELTGVVIGNNLGPLYSQDLSTIGLINPNQILKLGKNLRVNEMSSDNESLNHVIKVQESTSSLYNKFKVALSEHNIKPRVNFSNDAFGKSMLSVYQLIMSRLDIPTFKVSLAGFDTHINQAKIHTGKLKQLATTLATMRTNLITTGEWDNTLILTYSEFGRRLKENANKGTDHGAAAPHFIMGGHVKGGLYGTYPALDNLDDRGDLIHTVDFRDVYATIAKKWLGVEPRFSHQYMGFI